MAFTLRTDDELDRALSALAESEGLSRQEVIRRAVIERYERMIDRWSDVLERLGNA